MKTVYISVDIYTDLLKSYSRKILPNAKIDKDEEYPTSAESKNHYSVKKRCINLGNLIVLQNNKKNKTTFDVVVIEPIRNEKKRRNTIKSNCNST